MIRAGALRKGRAGASRELVVEREKLRSGRAGQLLPVIKLLAGSGRLSWSVRVAKPDEESR